MADLSICIPVHDDRWLQETLDSIEPIQPIPGVEHEIVVVKDTDGRGPGWARNRCFEQATGEWIVKMDADDLFTPGLLAALWQNRNLDLIVCPGAAQFFDETGLRHRWSYAGITSAEVMTRQDSPASGAGALLYHRTIEENLPWPETFGAYEGWVWVCQQVIAGMTVLPIAGTEYLHRLHPDSYWGQRSEGRQADIQRAMCAVNEVYAEAFG